jgi:alpha-L-rhamnosidase
MPIQKKKTATRSMLTHCYTCRYGKQCKYAAVANGLLNDKSLTQCSVYFKYYLNQALVKAGLGDDYISWLGIYRENIAMGLTTWAEYSDVNTSRSDCHAWGSKP